MWRLVTGANQSSFSWLHHELAAATVMAGAAGTVAAAAAAAVRTAAVLFISCDVCLLDWVWVRVVVMDQGVRR